MFIKIKEDALGQNVQNLKGWILEVKNETTNKINGVTCAERFVMTDEQVNKLCKILSNRSIIPYIFIADAYPVAIDPNEFIGIDEHNFLAAMNNLSRQHGFRIQTLDYGY